MERKKYRILEITSLLKITDSKRAIPFGHLNSQDAFSSCTCVSGVEPCCRAGLRASIIKKQRPIKNIIGRVSGQSKTWPVRRPD